jgi:rubredoxin
VSCPKCGEPRGERESCRRCGLVFANWTGAPVDEGPAGAAELWAAVEADWSSDARHDLFIEHCRKANALAHAASRYRRRDAADRLAQIQKLAEQTLAVLPRSAPPAAARRMPLWAGIVLVVLLLAGGYAFLQAFAP